MAATSYITCTQAPTSLSQNTIIASTSSTVNNSSDWSNNGTGKYTYSGSTSGRFVFHLDVKIQNFTSSVPKLVLVKNSLFTSINNATFRLFEWTNPISNNVSYFGGSGCSTPFVMDNGDYLELAWMGATTASGVISDMTMIIINAPYKTTPSSYLISTQSDTSVPNYNYIVSASTNVAASSEWSDNGTGVYSYNGSLPMAFCVEIDFKITNYSSSSYPRLWLVKNGYIILGSPPSLGQCLPPAYWNLYFFATLMYITQSSNTIVMRNGDYFRLLWAYDTDGSVNFTNKISIVNTRAS